jgi:hypothetical protein
MLFLNSVPLDFLTKLNRNISKKRGFFMENIDSKHLIKENKVILRKNKIHENFKFHFLSIFSIFSFDYSKNLDVVKTKNDILGSIIIDANDLDLKREDIFDDNFLFSPDTTKRTEIEIEVDQIEDDEYKYSTWRNTQMGLTVGGSACSIWFAYKGLTVWEKWMKDQEQKDIEEEIKLTGTYIDPGAGNIETSIDPVTGKRIQIKDGGKKKDF